MFYKMHAVPVTIAVDAGHCRWPTFSHASIGWCDTSELFNYNSRCSIGRKRFLFPQPCFGG